MTAERTPFAVLMTALGESNYTTSRYLRLFASVLTFTPWPTTRSLRPPQRASRMQGTEAPTAPPYEPGSGAPSTPPYSPGGSSGDTCPTNSRCALPAPTHPTAPHRSIKQAQKGAPLAARRAAVRRDPRTLTLLPRPAASTSCTWVSSWPSLGSSSRRRGCCCSSARRSSRRSCPSSGGPRPSLSPSLSLSSSPSPSLSLSLSLDFSLSLSLSPSPRPQPQPQLRASCPCSGGDSSGWAWASSSSTASPSTLWSSRSHPSRW